MCCSYFLVGVCYNTSCSDMWLTDLTLVRCKMSSMDSLHSFFCFSFPLLETGRLLIRLSTNFDWDWWLYFISPSSSMISLLLGLNLGWDFLSSYLLHIGFVTVFLIDFLSTCGVFLELINWDLRPWLIWPDGGDDCSLCSDCILKRSGIWFLRFWPTPVVDWFLLTRAGCAVPLDIFNSYYWLGYAYPI